MDVTIPAILGFIAGAIISFLIAYRKDRNEIVDVIREIKKRSNRATIINMDNILGDEE